MARKKIADFQQDGKKEVSEKTVEKLREYGFKKGQSGNPAGMPPGTVRLSTAIQAVANRVNNKTGLTYLQTLLVVMFIESIEGDKETRQMLFDRGFGTLLQKNMIMQLGGDILKMAKDMGLEADDLSASPTLRGLLEVAEGGLSGTSGIEGDQGSEGAEAFIPNE